MGQGGVILGIIAVIILLWFAQGGPNTELANGGPFLTPPTTYDFSHSYGLGYPSANTLVKLPVFSYTPSTSGSSDSSNNQNSNTGTDIDGTLTQSPYNGIIKISKSTSGPRRNTAKTEYLILRNADRNAGPVNVSGWTLESEVTGKRSVIPQGTKLPLSGTISAIQNIVLEPNTEARISTGRSPIGASFQINKCTGYFEQYQDFSPSLPLSCPTPKNEFLDFFSGDISRNESCENFVDDIPRCTLVNQIPPSQAGECQTFVSQNLNYNGCVRLHQNDSDFYDNEWRVYLGRTSELWKDRRETILLLDSNGMLVDSFSY